MHIQKFSLALGAIAFASMSLGLLLHVLVREIKFNYLPDYDLQLVPICFAALVLGFFATSITTLKSVVKNRLFGSSIIIGSFLVTASALAIRFPENFGLAYSFYYGYQEWYVLVYGVGLAFAITCSIFFSTTTRHSKFERITNATAAAAIQIACCVLMLRFALRLIFFYY